MNIRPTYSPIRPSITSWVPEKMRIPAIAQPQPYSGPMPSIQSHAIVPSATSPSAATHRPSAVARRSGSSEKFTHALSHNRTSRPSV